MLQTRGLIRNKAGVPFEGEQQQQHHHIQQLYNTSRGPIYFPPPQVVCIGGCYSVRMTLSKDLRGRRFDLMHCL
jgi:hypothetical protein